MTAAAIRERIKIGTPLRLGEIAAATGYSREHVRKLANAGVFQSERPPRPGSQRRVKAAEAERFFRSEGLI